MDFRNWLVEEEETAISAGIDPIHTGKNFNNFFSNVSKGEFGKSNVGWQPSMDMGEHKPFHDEVSKHTGHFDDHIAKSIPTFREIQVKKGHAIVRAFGSTDITMIDIGGGEGSLSKTITSLSKGNIKTKVLDPNPNMESFYKSKSQVPGSHYDNRAFYRGWTDDDGTEVKALNADNTPDRYDVATETMVFQFMNNQRATHVREAKRLLKPGGLFIAEEKLKTNPEVWKDNEAFKDINHKNTYYSSDELAAKEKIVGFQQGKAQEKSIGMVDNMVTVEEFEAILLHNFRFVWQYWDSGNFKGYAASDNAMRVAAFVRALGNTNSKYSRVSLPRKVERQ